MSDGDDSLEEQASLVTPKPGEVVQVGDASYNEEEFYSKSGGSAFLQDQFRMEDNKKAWDASLDADVQATAEMLAEQMRANPETAADVAEQGGEELGEFVDPLGLGVLNQSTMALESADSAKAGNTRRQLKKLARWQAESTMRLGKVESDPQQVCSLQPLPHQVPEPTHAMTGCSHWCTRLGNENTSTMVALMQNV